METIKLILTFIKIIHSLLRIIIKKNLLKDIKLKIEIKYTAENTLKMTCKQIFGNRIQELYFILSVYDPIGGSLILTDRGKFNNFSNNINEITYGPDVISNEGKWYIIKEATNFSASNKLLDIPWIFEYSFDNIKKISFQFENSKQFGFKHLIEHLKNAFKKNQE